MKSRIDWPHAATIALGVLAGSVAVIGTAFVAVGGFMLSFDAITEVAKAAHISPRKAWLMPATIDGAMAVATVVAVVMHRLHRSTAYAWTVVLVGALISIGCNAVHAYLGGALSLPREVAMAVSAIPPVMLALAVHLLVLLIETLRDKVAPVVTAAPVPAQPAPVLVPVAAPVAESAPVVPRQTRKPAAKKAAAKGKTAGPVALMRAEYERITGEGGVPAPADLARVVREATGKEVGGMAARYLATWQAPDVIAEAEKVAAGGGQ